MGSRRQGQGELGGLTALARPSSTGTGDGDQQGVKTPWPLTSDQKGHYKKTKPHVDIKRYPETFDTGGAEGYR